MHVRDFRLPLFLVFSNLLLSGCAAQMAAQDATQSAILHQCMTNSINEAEYITSRTSASQVVDISYMKCRTELFSAGAGSNQQPVITPSQRSIYEDLARERIIGAPQYRFKVKSDQYKGTVSVEGIDYISNSGASENYYTKAALSAEKVAGGKAKYFITIIRSGSEKAEFRTAYFKGGAKLSAIPVGGDVNCVDSVFCFWTEGAVVEIPYEFLSAGKSIDFKLSGRADSEPVEIPSEYISMFISEVDKSLKQ